MIFKTLLVAGSFLLPTIAMEPQEQQDRLPRLSDDDMQAGSGGSAFYSPKVKWMFGEMHAQGDTWPFEKLDLIFSEGLFQHYYAQFTKFDYENNYDQYKTYAKENKPLSQSERLKIDLLKNKYKIRIGFSQRCLQSNSPGFKHFCDLVEWYREMGDALRTHSTLRILGADYQREKVVVEKLDKQVREGKTRDGRVMSEEEKTACYQELLARDQKNIDMITLIFYWMKDACQEMETWLKEYFNENQEIPLGDNNAEFVTRLRAFYPDYVYRPVYLSFLKNTPLHNLPQAQEPAHQPVVQPARQHVLPAAHQPVVQPARQHVLPAAHQPVVQPVRQSVLPAVHQPVVQPLRRPAFQPLPQYPVFMPRGGAELASFLRVVTQDNQEFVNLQTLRQQAWKDGSTDEAFQKYSTAYEVMLGQLKEMLEIHPQEEVAFQNEFEKLL